MTTGRMFSKEVTDSDAFVTLPATAQTLYLHLNLSCDNWGVTAQTSLALMKAHATEEDLKELVERRFVLHIGNIYIVKHWFLMNTLRIERLKKSVYFDDFENVLYIKPNLAYTDNFAEGCQTITEYCQRFAKKSQTFPKVSKDFRKNVEAFPEVEVEEEYKNKNIEIGNIEEEVEHKKATPSIADIEAYIKEKGYNVDAERFFEYYTANSWLDNNGKPVKNWKQKVISWNANERTKKKVYTLDEMEVKEVDVEAIRQKLFKKGA